VNPTKLIQQSCADELQIMVAMLEHPSLEIAGLALEFWGMLGELLTETAAGGAGGGAPGTGPRSPALEESVRHACRLVGVVGVPGGVGGLMVAMVVTFKHDDKYHWWCEKFARQ